MGLTRLVVCATGECAAARQCAAGALGAQALQEIQAAQPEAHSWE